jgi:regulator of sirC expression with transglutaminase-like and TPR domain
MALQLDAALDRLGRDPTASFDLAEIALLLARDEFPYLDVEGHLSELTAMAQDVQRYLRGHLSHQVQGLCRYLFHEMGFRGNQRDYYDPQNSYFNVVLERRLGIPISLSAVMLAIGQRAGLQLAGVGLPGHFIVRAQARGEEILIDPFHGGRILSLADCEYLVEQSTGTPFDLAAVRLEPIPVGLILRRMLTNLKAIYVKQEDWPRSARTMERLRQLDPDNVLLRRDLGICYLRRQHPGKAIDLLQSYLTLASDAADADAVREMHRTAVRLVAQWN